MCAATVRASYASGAGPSLATAETGAKYNREESLAGATTPVPKPTATGTNYSWPKVYCLEVTATDSTNISNRRYHMASAPSAGLTLWFKDDGTTYTQVTAVAAADNGSTNDAAPATYSAAATSATVYDSASISAGSTGRNGDYIRIALGVSNLYVGGAGSAIALPNLIFTYDES